MENVYIEKVTTQLDKVIEELNKLKSVFNSHKLTPKQVHDHILSESEDFCKKQNKKLKYCMYNYITYKFVLYFEKDELGSWSKDFEPSIYPNESDLKYIYGRINDNDTKFSLQTCI
jgi:hypothetical protein